VCPDVAVCFKITLETLDGTQEFQCPGGVHILDEVEEESLELSYFCRVSSYYQLCWQVLSDLIEQSDQAFLDDDQMGDGLFF